MNILVIFALLTLTCASEIGIKLPTVNGVASSLDYYEEFSVNISFYGGVNHVPSMIELTRIGNIVVMNLENFTLFYSPGAFNYLIYTSTAIPSRFCPKVNRIIATANVISNGGVHTVGYIELSFDGYIFIYRDFSKTIYYYGSNSGLYEPISTSWLI